MIFIILYSNNYFIILICFSFFKSFYYFLKTVFKKGFPHHFNVFGGCHFFFKNEFAYFFISRPKEQDRRQEVIHLF